MERHKLNDYQWEQIKNFISSKISKYIRAIRERRINKRNDMGIKNRFSMVCVV